MTEPTADAAQGQQAEAPAHGAAASHAAALHGDQGAAAHDDHDHGLSHLMPVSTLIGVFVLLIGLTWLTVEAATWDVGRYDLVVALSIAVAKSTLVVLYFMHLRYDKPFNALLFIGSLAVLALFIILVLIDTREYQHEIRARTIEYSQPAAPR